jgi:hypothetical protein
VGLIADHRAQGIGMTEMKMPANGPLGMIQIEPEIASLRSKSAQTPPCVTRLFIGLKIMPFPARGILQCFFICNARNATRGIAFSLTRQANREGANVAPFFVFPRLTEVLNPVPPVTSPQ